MKCELSIMLRYITLEDLSLRILGTQTEVCNNQHSQQCKSYHQPTKIYRLSSSTLNKVHSTTETQTNIASTRAKDKISTLRHQIYGKGN